MPKAKLFKPELLQQALQEYRDNPDAMNIHEYENRKDPDSIPEPLPLAYKDMFKAIELGCNVVYDRLDDSSLRAAIGRHQLVQTSIKTRVLYPDERASYHSLLIYDINNDVIRYHDPFRGPGMTCTVSQLIKAANGTGACMVYA